MFVQDLQDNIKLIIISKIKVLKMLDPIVQSVVRQIKATVTESVLRILHVEDLLCSSSDMICKICDSIATTKHWNSSTG